MSTEGGCNSFSVARLKLIASEGCRLTFQIRLLEGAAGLRRLGDAAEGSRDQPPLLVGREHPTHLQAGHERGMVSKEVAPQGPQTILFLDRPDLDAEARGARRNVEGGVEIGGLRGVPRGCRSGGRWRG
jgi:hypothetical protein